MNDDRTAQARAEAERRWPGKMALAPVMKARFLDGVEWADANPKPHTITASAPQPEPWQALADEMEELYDGYSVRAAEAAQFLHERGVRVLHSAPQPEPWQALADVLADMGHMSPTGHAKDLHERGVRLVGGDDDE